MRLATFQHNGRERVCVHDGGNWFPVDSHGEPSRDAVLRLLADPAQAAAHEQAPLDEGAQRAMPYLPARDVFCLGKNYREHAAEFTRYNGDAEEVPSAPIVFTKSTRALCGPHDDLTVHPELAGALDYEAELVVVIGSGGHHIRAADALEHVAAYSVLNDTSARDLQRTHVQWYLAKSLPRATPWGPELVTPDELEAFSTRVIHSSVNGEPRQSATLGDMIVSVSDAIACISSVVALEPGDLIAMGTPSGVGIGFDPPRFLTDGDEVACGIEGLGQLRNRVVISAG